MQAIETYVLPATDTKGTRVKARTASGISRTHSWDHALDGQGNHWCVACDLAMDLDWSEDGEQFYREWVRGSLSDREVFVRAVRPDGEPLITIMPKMVDKYHVKA